MTHPTKPYLYAALFLAFFSLWGGDCWASELLTFEVRFKDGRIIPARLEVPANTKFKLVLKNEGDDPIEFESFDIQVEKVLGPGASSFLVMYPMLPGTFNFFDEFHPTTGEMLLVVK